MHKIWQRFDVNRLMPALAIFLFSLAIIIHFILLSTDRYNWLDGPSTATAAAPPAATATP